MSSPDGRPPARRGFFASLSDAMAPKPIPDDDTAPLVAPRGVVAAMVLSIVAGAVYIFSGGLGVLTLDTLIKESRKVYQGLADDCIAQFGGIGTDAVTAESPSGTASTCQGLTEMTGADWSSFRTASLVVSVVFLLMGVLLVAAGWFLKAGRTWARRSIVGVATVTVLAALMLGMSSPILLAATLLLLVAIVMCYLSSGATYFLRVKARRHA